MFKKKTNGIDHGSTLPYKCSGCGSFGLNLKEHPKASTGNLISNLALKVWGKDRPLYFFECPSCKLIIEIPDEEAEEVKKLNIKAEEFQEGLISEKEYIDTLLQTDSKTVKQIYERSNSWDCPECSNEVPATFEVCWNCGTECPNPENLAEAEGELKLNTSCVFGSSYTNKDDPSKHIL